MKLLEFKANKVFDYIDINLDFKINHNLSIITGGNGTGKTTAIRLLKAVLTPDIPELIEIPFDDLRLSFERIKPFEIIEIRISKKEGFKMEVNNMPPFVLEKERIKEFLSIASHERNDINEHIFRFEEDSSVLKYIFDLPKPIIIGLDRRNGDAIWEKDINNTFDRRHNRTMMMKEKYLDTNQREYKGTLGLSLLETELLIQDLYRRLRAVEDSLSTKLQKELIKTSFDFKNIEELLSFNINKQTKILERRDEIRNALSKVTNNDAEIDEKLCKLFEKLETIFSKKPDKNNSIQIEIVLNLTQINRLTSIVQIIDEHNSKIANSFRPINNYLNIVNSFFKDSGKTLFVDEVGHLLVKRPGLTKPTSIGALSSGERHIVILFANAMFNKMKNSQNNVLIIDEPELSLHIRWQDKFIDSLLSVTDKKNQLILATHSPDIVGDYKDNCIAIN